MNAVSAENVSQRYGSVVALDSISVDVPEGVVYALLGPNGAGKTTLLQVLGGLRRPSAGRALLRQRPVQKLSTDERAGVGYVGEGQRLPGWMKLRELEAWLAPLYRTWDPALAGELRRRFRLDPERPVRTFSRGERMKAALLCTLAPRPSVVLMDEPFAGMDIAVRDDLSRGLLEAAGSEGWTVVISSHDLAELEGLADWVGFLDRGRLLLSESTASLNLRFRRVEILTGLAGADTHLVAPANGNIPASWLSLERAGRRVSFITSSTAEASDEAIRRGFPDAERVAVREASLREVFIALARREVAA